MSKKISIGVTGFARSGKTVFICAFIQALLTAEAWSLRRGQGPLARFAPFERGQLKSVKIKTSQRTDLPQFPFKKVRESLTGSASSWPLPTEGVSRIYVEVKYSPLRRFMNRDKTLMIELVDFPGEWLIDLPMLEMTYEQWSEAMLEKAGSGRRNAWSEVYRSRIERLDSSEYFDEDLIEELSDDWLAYMADSIKNGYTLNQPGRLLRPDSMRHSPVLRLCPLPARLVGSELWSGMEKRYKDYQKQVIKPFYKKHLSKIDRQIVLVDILKSMRLGEEVFTEMTTSLSETLKSFNYGNGGPLSFLLGGSTTHLLFAATKCDHVVRGDRANIEETLKRMIAHVDDENQIRASSFKFGSMALSSIKVTEDRKTMKSPVREILYGLSSGESEPKQYDPGGVPLDFPPTWDEMDFVFYDFQPMNGVMTDAMYEGFPAYNLGKAIDFLIGDDFS